MFRSFRGKAVAQLTDVGADLWALGGQMTGAVAWRGQDLQMNACKCFSALARCFHLIGCGFCGGVRGQLH